MPTGVDPNDIYHNGAWYNRSGQGAALQYIETALPFIVPSSGSVAANGAITLTTALDTTYTSAFMYFPASVFTGSAAGFYYVVMSSTTLGQMYTNVYTSGLPEVPTSLVAVSTGAGAYTQTTGADFTGLSLSIAAGLLGTNGFIRAEQSIAINNTAGTKTARMSFGGSTYGTVTTASSTGLVHSAGLVNMGVANAQQCFGFGQGTSTHTNSYLAIDSSVAQTLSTIYRLATATDWIVSRSVIIQINNT